MVDDGIDLGYVGVFIQYGLEVIIEVFKIGGVINMMDCFLNFVKVKVFEFFEQLIDLFCLLFEKY